jgi:hypothetical protein
VDAMPWPSGKTWFPITVLQAALGYRSPEEFEKQAESRNGDHAFAAARIGALEY